LDEGEQLERLSRTVGLQKVLQRLPNLSLLRARGPKRHFRRKRKPGQPVDSRKLCDRLRKQICEHIRRGLSKEDASRLCGITRETLRQWRGRGEEEANGPYYDFADAVELAELHAKDAMIQRLLKDRDAKWTWNILKNRYPHEFKERLTTEVNGPDGGPIPRMNPFQVEVIINGDLPQHPPVKEVQGLEGSSAWDSGRLDVQHDRGG
jgi:hypothetical protein